MGTANDSIAAKERFVVAGSGDDVVRGSCKGGRIHGENGDDRLVGKGGTDKLFGGTGNDVLLGGGRVDVILEGLTTAERNRVDIELVFV